jgi:hypothetical protein
LKDGRESPAGSQANSPSPMMSSCAAQSRACLGHRGCGPHLYALYGGICMWTRRLRHRSWHRQRDRHQQGWAGSGVRNRGRSDRVWHHPCGRVCQGHAVARTSVLVHGKSGVSKAILFSRATACGEGGPDHRTLEASYRRLNQRHTPRSGHPVSRRVPGLIPKRPAAA